MNQKGINVKLRKKYDKEDSEKRLLKAALDIFSKCGYEGATTRAIALKADVNDSLIQRYFGGKMGLLIALLNSFREQTSQQHLAYKGENIGDEVAHYLRTRYDFVKKHKKLMRVILTQALVSSEFREELAKFHKDGVQIQGWRKDLSKFVGVLSIALNLSTQIIGSLDEEYAEEFIQLAAQLMSKK